MNITAAEVTHLETLQTFGYVVSEPEPSQRIDVDKATKLGVAPGRKYRKLKNGVSVMSDNGIREVKPEQVLAGANRKIRKLAYIGDNCGLSSAMTELCMNTDVLVHEAVSSVESAEVSLVGIVTCCHIFFTCNLFAINKILLNFKGCTHERPFVCCNGGGSSETC